ncbi:MAG: MFS transporter [Candidatus Diapherotrites archaeon]|nr:MFS transporter [Candidatus Diapherotrites archaeon]
MAIKKLVALNAAFTAAVGLGWTLFVPYLVSLGYSYLDVMLFFAAFFSSALFVMLFTRNWKIKNYLTLGLGTRALTFLAVTQVSHHFHLFLVAIIYSFIMTDFWVVYNSLVEKQTTKHNRAFTNSIVMGAGLFVNIIAPVAAGVIASQYGFHWAFAAGFLAMLPTIYLARGLGEKRRRIDLFPALKSNKRVQEIIFLEGFAHGASWIIPMVVTLQFVTGVVEFGAFFAYLALAGAVSALFLGKKSDKDGNRGRYITPVMVFSGIALAAAGFADSLLFWAVAMGASRFVDSIKWPFTWTLITESAKTIEEGMLVREFWLNSGRMASIMVTVACLAFFGSVQYGLVFGGAAAMLFPVAMKLRKLG